MDLAGSKSGSDVDYIRQIIDRQLADLHTCIPALVESFDPATQMIECIPVIRARKKDIDGNETTEDRPKLVKVPLITPYVRTLGFSLTMPILPGDMCLLIFAERGLDYWQETGEISDPPEDIGARMHDITDGIAAIGPISKPDAIIDYQIDSAELRNEDRTGSFQLWPDELEVRIPNGTFTHQKANGDIDTESVNDTNTKIANDENVTVENESKKVITGDALEYSEAKLIKNANGQYELHSDVEVIIKAPIVRLCDDTIVQGNLVVTGELTAGNIAYTPHVHTGITVGAGSTGGPVAGPGPGPAPATCPDKPEKPTLPDPERRGP